MRSCIPVRRSNEIEKKCPTNFFRFRGDIQNSAKLYRARFFEFFEILLRIPWRRGLVSPYKRAIAIEKKCSKNFFRFHPRHLPWLARRPGPQCHGLVGLGMAHGGHTIGFIFLCEFHEMKRDFSTRRPGGFQSLGFPKVKQPWLVQQTTPLPVHIFIFLDDPFPSQRDPKDCHGEVLDLSFLESASFPV